MVFLQYLNCYLYFTVEIKRFTILDAIISFVRLLKNVYTILCIIVQYSITDYRYQ